MMIIATNDWVHVPTQHTFQQYVIVATGRDRDVLYVELLWLSVVLTTPRLQHPCPAGLRVAAHAACQTLA